MNHTLIFAERVSDVMKHGSVKRLVLQEQLHGECLCKWKEICGES